MTEEEKNTLREELKILRDILDIHTQNPDIWKYNEKGLEEYIDAVLDRMNEIKDQLKEFPSS